MQDIPVLEATVDHEDNLTFLDNLQHPSPCGTINENYETETNVDNIDSTETSVCVEHVPIVEAEVNKTVDSGESSDTEESTMNF